MLELIISIEGNIFGICFSKQRKSLFNLSPLLDNSGLPVDLFDLFRFEVVLVL